MAHQRNWILRLAIGVGLPVGGYLLLFLLTPTCGRVVGFADQQPPLRTTSLPNGWAPKNVDVIHRLARLHFDNQPALQRVYWPEPMAIEERTDCWIVTFASRTPIYEWLGYRRTVPPKDLTMYFTIDKADFRTRFGIWCR